VTEKLSYAYDKFEDTKGVIRGRRSRTDRKYNGQRKNDKKKNEVKITR
jgi:hypothetical protein